MSDLYWYKPHIAICDICEAQKPFKTLNGVKPWVMSHRRKCKYKTDTGETIYPEFSVESYLEVKMDERRRVVSA